MDVDDTMTVCSLRQAVGSILGGGNLASSWGTYIIPAAIAKRPIPAGAILTGIMCVLAVVIGYPMDLAAWAPVLRVALIVGVFVPLLEVGMQIVSTTKQAQSAGTCIIGSALVNPVFGWSLAMLLENAGFVGNIERGEKIPKSCTAAHSDGDIHHLHRGDGACWSASGHPGVDMADSCDKMTR